MKLKLYIIIIIIVLLCCSLCYNIYEKYELFNNINNNHTVDTILKNYNNDNMCEPSGILAYVFDNKKINHNKYIIPCSYDTCEKDIKTFENTKNNLFIIDGCDILASKINLWKILKKYYGNDVTKYVPYTFILNNDMNFREHYYSNKIKKSDQIYVLKNYNQRQEGIKLTRDLQEIESGYKNGWYLVQDYIYDPFIIDKRKINFRYYLLIVCNRNSKKIDAYLHKDGFLYYTPDYYDEYDISFNKHITTGYIDRAVYEKNPLTLQDFRNHLNNIKPELSNYWDKSVQHLITKVVEALSTAICKNDKLTNTLRFQLFGCDVAPDSKLGCKLMEINKGPDMNAKDDRDKQVKTTVQTDIFNIIEDNNLSKTNFIKIF
jgi:hypothetical protein